MACKTLEAYAATPTAHKQRKLENEHYRYERLLRDSFRHDCDTQSAVNTRVSGEELNWHSKNALKQYVPQLLDDDTYDADTLADDHPIRYANTAAEFDRDPSRHHEICWKVPMPGYGTDFWIPLQINPNQEEWWYRLLGEEDDSVWAGELRVQRDGDRWVVHATANYESDADDADDEELRTRDDVTPVGFDVGESKLLVGCALRDGKPVDPLFVDGGRVKHLRQKQASAEDRLKARDADTLPDDLVWGDYQHAVDDEIEKAAREAVDYARQFPDPVIVLERLTGISEEDLGEYWNRRLGKWLFSELQGRIEDKAEEADIPVVYVWPHHTSKTCHACNHVGYRPHQGTFKCTFSKCWVSEYQADLNAAGKIAQRLNPWGESLPVRKQDGGDDSPCGAVRSGAPVAEPQDTDASEATLGEDAAMASDGRESGNTVRAGAADDKTLTSTSGGAGDESPTASPDAS